MIAQHGNGNAIQSIGRGEDFEAIDRLRLRKRGKKATSGEEEREKKKIDDRSRAFMPDF